MSVSVEEPGPPNVSAITTSKTRIPLIVANAMLTVIAAASIGSVTARNRSHRDAPSTAAASSSSSGTFWRPAR